MLVNGMVRVIKINIEWVTEDADSLFKSYSVFLKITCRLLFIPLKVHETEYSIEAFELARASSKAFIYANLHPIKTRGCLTRSSLSPGRWQSILSRIERSSYRHRL